jgi:hypothetical protein
LKKHLWEWRYGCENDSDCKRPTPPRLTHFCAGRFHASLWLVSFGRHVPSDLAETYFDAIAAPCKKIVCFEQAAHNPPFEESEKFNRVLIDEILPVSDSTLITFSRLIGANLKPIFSLSFCAWLIEDGALAPAACRFDPNNQPLLP